MPISALFKITSFAKKGRHAKKAHEERSNESLDFLGFCDNVLSPLELDDKQSFVDVVCIDIVRMQKENIAHQSRWKIPTELDGNKNKIINQCRKRCKGVYFALEDVGSMHYV